MKTWIFTSALIYFFSSLTQAQNEQTLIRSEEGQSLKSNIFSPFTKLSVPSNKSESDSPEDYYTMDFNSMKKVYDSEVPLVTLQFLRQEEKLEVTFTETKVFTDNVRIQTSSGKVLSVAGDLKCFTGEIKGRKGWATMTIGKQDINIVIADEKGNYEISSDGRGLYRGAFTKMKNVMFDEPFDTNAINDSSIKDKTVKGSRYGNCLEIFLECDFHAYNTNGSSVSSTNNWVARIMVNVQAVFNLHQVPVLISDVFIWDTQDPYTAGTNLSSVNQLFVNNRQNNYVGRLAVLCSTRNLGGGLAHGIGGFCNQYPQFPGPFCVNTSLEPSTQTFPTYSYNTYLVAHELGHVLGLRHSHACVWNGNYTQVDDCGNVYAYENNQTIEGENCFDENNPILPQGTIMSHCHLLTGVGINLSSGFGPIIGQRLYENYTYADCLTGQICNHQAPPNDFCTSPVTVPVRGVCTFETFSNFNATISGTAPGFSCGNPGITQDVWFRVVVPASGNVTIETGQVNGGLTDMIMQVYTGACNALVPLACDDNSGSGNHALISLSGRTPGEVLSVRIVDSGGNETGTFGLCAHDNSLPCHPDFQHLVSFYNGTGGASWTQKSGWMEGAAGTNCNVCSWYGITCNDDGRVMEIRLPNNNVTGTLPSTLVNIEKLRTLVLYDNNISGNLPAWLPDLIFLQTLDLGGNNISGTLPPFLATMPSISDIYLDNNNMTGTLLPELGNMGLSLLYLNDNDFEGCFPPEYISLCSESYNFTNNPDLPGNGNFSAYCTDGTGGDADSDGFCKGPDDCDDEDPFTYIGAPEICDGKDNDCDGTIDEGSTPLTNTWIGATGNWNVPSSWSLGVIPAKCMNVIINTNVTVTVPDGHIGLARSVTTSNGAVLIIATGAALETL